MHDKLDSESTEQFQRRVDVGHHCMVAAHGTPCSHDWVVDEEDRETCASDAIADILTALFGPAGTSSCGGAISYDQAALDKAQDFLAHALDSYRGDAEDYTREPEPGEYGHEDEWHQYLDSSALEESPAAQVDDELPPSTI